MKELTLYFLSLCGAVAICGVFFIFGYYLFDELRTKYKRWRYSKEKERAARERAKTDLGLDNLVVVWDDGDDFYYIGIDAGGDCAFGFNAEENHTGRVPFAYKIPLNEFTPKKAKEIEL